MAKTDALAGPGSRLLEQQLLWFVQLRWIAGAAVVIGSLLDRYWFAQYGDRTLLLEIVGASILIYNAVFYVALKQTSPQKRNLLLLFAWIHLLADFISLATLITLTHGLRSPLLGFFVFHMVFASLLLPRLMALAATAAAIAIVGTALFVSNQSPASRGEWFTAFGAVVTLIGVVFLANHLTRSLRRQRRQLLRQNKRIRKVSRQMRRQHRLLAQHEKMVALGQMAAGVAHEIANPLASMDSLLQLAQRKPENPRPDLVQKLRDQVARVSQIVQQMRSFSHPTDGQWQHQPVNTVVEQALDILRFDKRLKRVQLIREFGDDVGSIALQPHALQQVIVNLFSNALDAVELAENPTVTVRTARRDGSVIIEVTDNGGGIRPEHMKRLFEPFFTTKEVGRGTGLGLSISYRLIDQQDGQLWARSELGAGATFTIRLRDRSTHSQIRETPAGAAVISGNPNS